MGIHLVHNGILVEELEPPLAKRTRKIVKKIIKMHWDNSVKPRRIFFKFTKLCMYENAR